MSDTAIRHDARQHDVRVTGRHMDVGEAFRLRINERLAEIVDKYHDPARSWSAHVIVEKSKVERTDRRFTADCTIRLGNGQTLHGEGQGVDADPAFAEAAERVEKRMRRHHRRIKEHRGHRKGPGPEAIEMAYAVLTAPQEDGEVADDFAPTIVAESVKQAQRMSVADAVLSLDMGDAPVLVFRNAKDDGVNVVYRRNDGHVGWIDMGARGAG